MRNLVRPSCLAVLCLAAACPRSSLAAATPPVAFAELARVWMGTVAFLADAEDGDRGEREGRGRGSMKRGDRCECGAGDCEKCRGGREQGHHVRGERHHGGPEGSRAVMSKMDDILARLSRIEAKLDGRAGAPPRGEWRGPRPPDGGRGPRGEMPEQMRRMMEERMREAREKMSPEERERFDARMKAMRERMRDGGPRPEGRPERGPEGRPAMPPEVRERMEQARRRFAEMEERIKKLEAEIGRLKADR